jgi:imidazolonepropionase-like amidohydrolase
VSSPPASPGVASAATAPKVAVTLFNNVRIFDGKAEKLSNTGNVMVRGNIIERVSIGSIESPADAHVTVIDGGGRTLMPGLIDAHWHAMLIRPTPAQAIAGDVGYNNIAAGAEATDTLLRGFTTVRDVGGPTFGLKQAIDEGIIARPRIFPLRRHDYDYRRARRFSPGV